MICPPRVVVHGIVGLHPVMGGGPWGDCDFCVRRGTEVLNRWMIVQGLHHLSRKRLLLLVRKRQEGMPRRTPIGPFWELKHILHPGVAVPLYDYHSWLLWWWSSKSRTGQDGPVDGVAREWHS